MKSLLALPFLLVLATIGWVRFAPADRATWHVSPRVYAWDHNGPWGTPVATTGGASLRLPLSHGQPAVLLAKLDAAALATPRTYRLAGSVPDGRITWVTRSLFWGFPDYTTAEVRPDGLYVHARLRFGRKDFGVNAARLTAWLAKLS